MPNTGWVFPGSGTTVSDSGTGHIDNTWSSPGNITADDTSEASVTATSFDTGDQTYILRAYNFNFSSIPAGSTIDGVEFQCAARRGTSPASGGDFDLIQLYDASAALMGSNIYNELSPSINLSTTETVHSCGDAAHLWGTGGITLATVQDVDFGVGIGIIAGGENADVFVEYVNLRITYTEPTVTNQVWSQGGLGV